MCFRPQTCMAPLQVADTCRLEVVCSRCVASSCEDDDMLDNGISLLEDDVVPHCKAVSVNRRDRIRKNISYRAGFVRENIL